MNTLALIWMLAVQITVTLITLLFIIRILKSDQTKDKNIE